MLKKISNRELDSAAEEIVKDPVYGKNEILLTEMFKKYPDNKKHDVVEEKVKRINTIFSTFLYTKKTTPISKIVIP